MDDGAFCTATIGIVPFLTLKEVRTTLVLEPPDGRRSSHVSTNLPAIAKDKFRNSLTYDTQDVVPTGMA